MSIRRGKLPTAAPNKWRSARPRSVARQLGRSASILVAAVPLLGAPQAHGCGGGGDPSPAVDLQTEEGLRRASDRTIVETALRAIEAMRAGAPIDTENSKKIGTELLHRSAIQSFSKLALRDLPERHLFAGELLSPEALARSAPGTATAVPPTSATPPTPSTPPPPAAGGSPPSPPVAAGAPATTWTIGPSVSYKPATPALLAPPTASTPTPNASDCSQPTCADDEARQRQAHKSETKRVQAAGVYRLEQLGIIKR